MAVNKKFLEAVSKDDALKAEFDEATSKALGEFLKAKGLEEEAAKAVEEATKKFAESKGFAAGAMEAVSEDELKAVAGGGCFCTVAGMGDLLGDTCGCPVYGVGDHYPHGYCKCYLGGAGGGERDY